MPDVRFSVCIRCNYSVVGRQGRSLRNLADISYLHSYSPMYHVIFAPFRSCRQHGRVANEPPFRYLGSPRVRAEFSLSPTSKSCISAVSSSQARKSAAPHRFLPPVSQILGASSFRRWLSRCKTSGWRLAESVSHIRYSSTAMRSCSSSHTAP